MVVPNYPYPITGGLEKQSHELATALQRKSLIVNVISTRIASTVSKLEKVDGIPVYRLPYSKISWIKNIVIPLQLFKQMLTMRKHFDVVHIHQISWFGLYAILCAWILNKPVITKLANIREKGIPGLIQSGWTGAIKLKILKLSKCIVAMNPESVNELAEINYPQSQTLLTPNGIQIRDFPIRPSSSSGRNVVFIGRLVKQKGVSDLLQAWTKVQATFPDARLSIFGDGPEMRLLTKQLRHLELDQSVTLHGHIDSAWKQLCNHDIFVLPSLMEGNSNAILEAMSAGLPIIASDVGGASMQVGADGQPYLVNAGDTDSLASKLCDLLKNPQKIHELGKNMQTRLKSYFDIDVVANSYLRAYELIYQAEYDKIHTANNPVIKAYPHEDAH